MICHIHQILTLPGHGMDETDPGLGPKWGTIRPGERVPRLRWWFSSDARKRPLAEFAASMKPSEAFRVIAVASTRGAIQRAERGCRLADHGRSHAFTISLLTIGGSPACGRKFTPAP